MNKKTLLGMVGGLVALGGAAFFVVGSVAVPSEGDDGSFKPGSEEYYTSDLQSAEIADVLVNLAGSRAQKFLEIKLTAKFRVGEDFEGTETIFEDKMPDILDKLNIYLSAKTLQDLEGAEAKQALKEEMLRLVNEAVFPEKHGRVEQLLYRGFAVQ